MYGTVLSKLSVLRLNKNCLSMGALKLAMQLLNERSMITSVDLKGLTVRGVANIQNYIDTRISM